MAATAKNATAEVAKTEDAENTSSTTQASVELNMVVSDTEDDEEFVGDDLSSFDEGAAPPEKDNPDLIILNRKIQEIQEAKEWKAENPVENIVVKRPEQNSTHPNVYFDKYMGMKKLKAVEQKLKFARGVLRRFSKKDPKTLKGGNRIKLQRAEKILAKVVADHKGVEYSPPKHEVYAPSTTVEDLKDLNFKAKNRIIIAAKKFVPKIEAKPVADRTPWEEVNYPFYKEVAKLYPEPVKPTPEEVQAYNKKKNAIKSERKTRHREDQLDRALNFIDYLLKYKDQPFTPMTQAKLERSFAIIQKQFKFQAAHKVEPSKTKPTVISGDKGKNAGSQQKGGQNKGAQNQNKGGQNQKAAPQNQKAQGGNQQKGGNQATDNNRKRPLTGPSSNARNNPAKVARNDSSTRSGSYNNANRRGGSGNFQGGNMNRVADIWSSVGAALNQLSTQSNFGGNQGSNYGNNQPDNFRRGGNLINDRDSGPSNFNSNISDLLFNRGGGGGGISGSGGFNDGPRSYNDNVGTGRGYSDRYNNNYNDDFNRGSNYNQGGGNDFRGNNDFGGNNSGYNQMGGGGGGGYNSGFSNNSGGGYGSLDLARSNRAPIDDLFTRNRSRH